MIPHLHHPSLIKDHNPICSPQGSDPVGDQNACLPTEDLLQSFQNPLLRLHVHRRKGIVQNEEGWIH